MKEVIINLPMFGIALTLVAYLIGQFAKGKFNYSLVNPLLIAIAITITFLVVFRIPYETYKIGGSLISTFLAPATIVIGLSIYRQLQTLKENFLPIIIGCFVGSSVSIISSIVLCKLFNLDEKLIYSMIPRAATSPIAMEITNSIGGIVPVAVASVIFSGIMGAVFAPLFIKILKFKNKVAIGVAMGTSSSAIGTVKAMELGEVEGAMSGLSIGITGLFTVILSLFL
ncbi:MAG: LrgB family protein [Anaerotignaceae bacterium]